MEEIIKIVQALRTESSTNGKIAILQNNKDNETLKKILYYTYSDNLQYGFSEIKLRDLWIGFTIKNLNKNIESTWSNGFEMLDELALSNTNDSLRNNVLKFLHSKSIEEQELWIHVLTKDLRCNISSKTINKAIKGLIVVWEIQQAHPIDKVKLKKNEWIALSLKLNGIRTSFFKKLFRSRQNKEMFGYQHIQKDIESIEWLKEYMVDGELIRKNPEGLPDNENFRLTTSIVNSDAEFKHEIEMVIFDIVPNDEFTKGESSKTFKDRLVQMQQLQNTINELGLTNIRIAPTYYTGIDHSQIEILLDEVDSKGYEGLVCLRDDKYKCKRHSGILKVKKFKTADCKITGYEEGTGKYKGMLGSFIINYKNNSVNVGSGYNDEQRIDFWTNRDKYIGRILEVKFKEESMDKKTKLISLQFPTFVCIREEGKEVSYN